MGKLSWSRLAEVALVLLLALGITCGADAAKRKSAKPAPPPPTADQFFKLKPMTVVIVQGAWASCLPNCPRWIAADGDIADSTPAQFRKVLKQAGTLKLPVLINSPGGSVNAALEIGGMLRKAGLAVAVAETSYVGCAPGDKTCQLPKESKGIYSGRAAPWVGHCASACPLILAGGVARYAGPGTYVGVHQFHNRYERERIRYLETYRMENGRKHVISRKIVSRKRIDTESYGIGKDMHRKLERYFAGMGVSPNLVGEMEKAPFTSLNVLTPGRLAALKLVSTDHGLDDLVGANACSAAPPAANCGPKILPPPLPDEMIVVRMRAKCKAGTPCPEWIMAEGTITSNTPQRFRAVLEQAEGQSLPVVLDSAGGDLDAALAIGRMIRARNLDTIVATTEPLGCSPRDAACGNKKPASLPYTGFTYGSGNCSRECLFVLAAGVRRSGVWLKNTVIPPIDGFSTHRTGRSARDIVASYLAAMRVTWDMVNNGLDTGTAELDILTTPAACKQTPPLSNCVRRGKAS